MSKNIDAAHQIEVGGTITVADTATTLLAANEDRRTVILQNLGTAPIYVYFGSAASTSNFSFILPGGSTNLDGTGGVFCEDVLSYTGIITAVVATGTGSVQVTAF